MFCIFKADTSSFYKLWNVENLVWQDGTANDHISTVNKRGENRGECNKLISKTCHTFVETSNYSHVLLLLSANEAKSAQSPAKNAHEEGCMLFKPMFTIVYISRTSWFCKQVCRLLKGLRSEQIIYRTDIISKGIKLLACTNDINFPSTQNLIHSIITHIHIKAYTLKHTNIYIRTGNY